MKYVGTVFTAYLWRHDTLAKETCSDLYVAKDFIEHYVPRGVREKIALERTSACHCANRVIPRFVEMGSFCDDWHWIDGKRSFLKR